MWSRLRRRPVLLALAGALLLFWVNFLTTSRWRDVDGALNGPKRPWFAAALLVATALCGWRILFIRRSEDRRLRADLALEDRRLRTDSEAEDRRLPPAGPVGPWAARAIAAAGFIFLIVCFVCVWFPPATWRQIPFLDNWPARYQATLDLVGLINHGTLAGWQWNFLGGYHSSSDVTVSLAVLAYVPMTLFGAAVGYHLLHLVLLVAVPALVWLDLRLDEAPGRRDATPLVAAGLAGLLAAGYSFALFRSGDTNSLAGVVTAFTALVGAHAARRGRAWGTPLVVAGLTLAEYSHAGFFLYAVLFLGLDALVARDWRSARRAGAATVCALVAALPLTWESWRYPAFFDYNNVVYARSVPFDWSEFVHRLWYNAQMLWLPERWLNDFTGLAACMLPVVAVLAVVDRTRIRFHAWALLGVVALLRLNDAQFGYAFGRPMYLSVVFLAPVLAAVVTRYTSARAFAWSLLAVVAIYTQVWYHQVPHVQDVRQFNAALVDRVASADGALVLVENNPHRNMNADPGGTTAPSRFGVHFEPLLAAATGRRLYAGYWDGWQWNPWKGQLVAGGTFMGRALSSTPHDAFAAELRRWGVADLFIWSDPTRAYLASDPRYRVVWRDEDWTEFQLADADTRSATVAVGQAALIHLTPLGADVQLTGVTRGELVVVRTNDFPAWQARADGQPVALVDASGQLGFRAPCDNACIVTLDYPRRPWLIALALAALTIGLVFGRRW